jgi:thiol-disulfide isomerase/thioredoxin
VPPESKPWPVWPWITLAIAVGVFLLFRSRGGLLEHTRADMGGNHVAVGKRIEQFDLPPLTGDPQPLTAASLEGKITLINFWGPWCPPCKIEFPHLLDVARHHARDNRFQFVSISCGLDDDEEKPLARETTDFLAEFKANIPTWFDPTQRVRLHLVREVGIKDFGYPTTLVVDRTGTIRGVWIGYSARDEVAISDLLTTLLREK